MLLFFYSGLLFVIKFSSLLIHWQGYFFKSGKSFLDLSVKVLKFERICSARQLDDLAYSTTVWLRMCNKICMKCSYKYQMSQVARKPVF